MLVIHGVGMTVPKSIGTRILILCFLALQHMQAKPVMMAREIISSMKAKAGGWQARSEGGFEGVRTNPPFSQDNPRNLSL